jgi:hypothetical protein
MLMGHQYIGHIRSRLLAALALAVSLLPPSSGILLAAPPAPATTVQTAAVPGPANPNAFATATTMTRARTTCDASDVLIGGGARVDGSTSNALHLNASLPSTLDGRPDGWTATFATGDQAVTGASTTAFAMCLDGRFHHVRVVTAETDGPSAANSSTRVTAVCPTDFVVVGGGAQTEPPTAGGLKPVGSFPSDLAGTPVSNLATNPVAWTAVGLNGGMPSTGAVTRVFAVCARAHAVSTQVVSATLAGPTTASTSLTVTAGCQTPGAPLLFGGGMFVSGTGGALPQSGVHVRGTYPSDAAGVPVMSGSAQYWSETTQTGGMPAPGTQSTVFALCAHVPAAPAPIRR